MIQPVIDSSGIIHIFKGKQTEPIKLVIGEILTAEIMDIFPTGNVQIKINDRILVAQPQRELPLNKGDTVYLKVEKPLSDGTIPLRILSTSELETTQQPFSNREISEKILKLIEVIFTDKTTQSLNESSYLNQIKEILNFPLEQLPHSEKSSLLKKLAQNLLSQEVTTDSLKELINLLENKSLFKEKVTLLNSLLVSRDEIAEKLQKVLLNTGVSFEAKLRSFISAPERIQNIQEDLKVVLNQILREAKEKGIYEVADKVENILRHIDGYQVLSKTFQSFFTFLPLLWKEIEGGNFAFKSLKKQGKEYYSVFINLKIKQDFLSFVVTMINRSFFISFSGKPEFVDIIKSYEEDLKERFYKQGLILSGINYVTIIEELLKQWGIEEGLVSVVI